MTTDYYQTLGVSKTATPEEIKKAYRKMAAKHHPDRENGDTAKFQKIEEAYRNLSDTDLKSRYDSGQSGPTGQPGGFPRGFSFSFGSNPFGGGGSPFDDLFSQFGRAQRRMYTVTLEVTLEQVAEGSEMTVQLNTPTGPQTFKVKVPLGIEDGAQVRYEGLMPDGDLQVQFRVQRHAVFERRGSDLYTRAAVSIWDLILGTTLRVKTLAGEELDIEVPARTNPGSTLRIQNHGLTAHGRRGHHFVLTSAVIPATMSSELLTLIGKERDSQNPT